MTTSKTNWIISAYREHAPLGPDKEFSSLSEAIKYAREEILMQKNPKMNIEWSFQTDENFEINFGSYSVPPHLPLKGTIVNISRADRWASHESESVGEEGNIPTELIRVS